MNALISNTEFQLSQIEIQRGNGTPIDTTENTRLFLNTTYSSVFTKGGNSKEKSDFEKNQ